MQLNDEQKIALEAIKEWASGNGKTCISLTGFAGTGKTTLLAFAKNFMTNVRWTSMTGKAASRLSEVVGVRATTLHSILYRQPDITKSGELKFNKINEPSCKYLTIDESSMVSPKIYEDLKYWIGCGVRILFVGDNFQLSCIINDEDKKAGYNEDFSIFSLITGPKLTQVMRNTDNIIKVATMIRNDGTISQKNTDDYRFVFSSSLITDAVDNYLSNRDDVVIITWRNQIRMSINKTIRSKLGYTNDIPEPGEPIFICRNGPGGSVLNGEIKIVKTIVNGKKVGEVNTYRLLTTDNKYLLVSLDGKDEFMDGGMPFIKNWKKFLQEKRKAKEEIIPISYGYCSTVHKMQGSQAKKIIIALYKDEITGRIFANNTTLADGTIISFGRRFLYTATSRAEKELNIIVGI